MLIKKCKEIFSRDGKIYEIPNVKKETTDKNYHKDPFRAVNFEIDENGTLRCPNGKAFHLQYRKPIKENAKRQKETVQYGSIRS